MQPMLMRLKQRYPGCSIDIFAPAWTAALLQAMPQVNAVISNPFPHGALQLSARYRLGRQLQRYDQAIVLPNSWKSALLPFFARIPLRTGFVGEARHVLLNDARRLDKNLLPLMVERFAYLAEDAEMQIPRPLANPKLEIALTQRLATLQKLQLNLDKPVVIFCPGAEYGPAKRWPAASFATIAQRLKHMGYAVWLIGSGKDQAIAEEIRQLAEGCCVNLCGKTTLDDALALLSVAALVISNDSGLMHLSAALDRPLLALFGSSSPQFTPPLSDQAVVIQHAIACSPCFKRVCPLGHFDCMNLISPDLVWDHLTALLPGF